MTACTSGLAKKNVLPLRLRLGCLFRIKLSVDPKLRGRRKIEQFLELRHEMDLASPFKDTDTLLRSNHRIPVKVSSPLFKFGEVFHRLQCPLGPKQPLNVHTPQTRRIETMAKFLGSDIPNKMRRCIRMSVCMAVKTNHSTAWTFGSAVLGLIELLLWKGRQQIASSPQFAWDLEFH